LPDIYLMPSKDVAKQYSDSPTKKEDWKWPRFHVDSDFMAKYRNNFQPLFKAIGIGMKKES